MKKPILAALALCYALGAAAQTPDTAAPEGYRFTDVKILPVTPVKDQSRSGTCWCYSTLSFLESEILRAGGPELDLSEMWIVRNIYFEKAVKYVRLHGSLNLAVGGQAHDVLHGIEAYGIVPEEVYPGLNYGYDKPNFDEIDAVIKAYADAVIKAGGKRSDSRLTTAWQAGLNGILDAYFGPMPGKFTYRGREYTPASFAASLPIDLGDYIEFTSFTHHPFYTEFAMEVPDNWNWDKVWNVPLDEFMQIIDNSLEKGYTISWGTDVSEKGFSRTKGLGIVPEADLEGMQEPKPRSGANSPRRRRTRRSTSSTNPAGSAPSRRSFARRATTTTRPPTTTACRSWARPPTRTERPTTRSRTRGTRQVPTTATGISRAHSSPTRR